MIVYRELSSLEQDLGFRAEILYAVSNNLSRHYRSVRIPKKGGGERCLSVPDPLLRSIQKQIADVLLIHMPVSRYATAYRPGSSVFRNAAPHAGKSLVLTLDIYRFFDHIRYSAVKDIAFPVKIYAEPLRILLTMLCYHRDVLPQGAPSSPVITNIIMKDFDDTVGHWCKSRHITYTRYCDDMTFSGNFDPVEVTAFVRDTLRPKGLLLNDQKTKVRKAGTRQTVTGIVVNERCNIPAFYRRKLRQEIYFCQKFGLESHKERLSRDDSAEVMLHRLLGSVNYCLQATPADPELLGYKTWLIDTLRSLNNTRSPSGTGV